MKNFNVTSMLVMLMFMCITLNIESTTETDY